MHFSKELYEHDIIRTETYNDIKEDYEYAKEENKSKDYDMSR